MQLEHCNMEEITQQSIPPYLPDVVLEGIATTLVGADKIRFMGACRQYARVTLRTAAATLKISQETKFVGLRKVLDSLPAEVNLEVVCLPGSKKKTKNAKPVSALAVFTDMAPNRYLTQGASACRWEAITKITMQADSIRCLVPQFLVLTCPQLTQLSLTQPGSDAQLAFTSDVAKAIPLTPCSSLKQLHLLLQEEPEPETNPWSTWSDCLDDGRATIRLPAAYHTIADLRHNLPNIDTLVMTVPNVDLIEAFAAQLTRLEVGQFSQDVEEPVRRCSRLQHLSTRRAVRERRQDHDCDYLVLPNNTSALKVLEATQSILQNGDIKRLLDIPSLTKLRLSGFVCEVQRHLPCQWQELHVNNVWQFTNFADLNLSSLKKLSIGNPDVLVYLPTPSNAGSRHAVQAAADSLVHVGKMMLEENNPNADYAAILWQIPFDGDEFEQEAADILMIAGQRVGPMKTCVLEHLLHRPLVIRAIVDWGHNFIESVYFGQGLPSVSSDAWTALQQLRKLTTVVYNRRHHDVKGGRDAQEKRTMCELVWDAAENYVIPTSRCLRLQFYTAQALHCDGSHRNRQLELHAAIQERLAAGTKPKTRVKVSSMELCPSKPTDRKSIYGCAWNVNAYWLVVTSPA